MLSYVPHVREEQMVRIYLYVFMRCLERKTKQHNTTRPRQLFFKEKITWDLNPRLSVF